MKGRGLRSPAVGPGPVLEGDPGVGILVVQARLFLVVSAPRKLAVFSRQGRHTQQRAYSTHRDTISQLTRKSIDFLHSMTKFKQLHDFTPNLENGHYLYSNI